MPAQSAEASEHHGYDPGTVTFLHGAERWSVSERLRGAFDVPRKNHLVFQTHSVIRRVRNFPADWRTLSAIELYALSWCR